MGREKEIEDLISLLKNPEVRLITLHGFGGTGKTRLAVETGHTAHDFFPDGVRFVALAPLDSTDKLLTATATALGFDFASSVDQKEQLFSYLQQKKLLLIFDNIEHLLPEATPFLEELLENAHRSLLLVTSRQPLNTPWEWAYPLRGLEYHTDQPSEAAPAVKLFLQHVRRRGEPLEEWDIDCATQVSQLVNGLPLGLLLAASWGRSLGCKEIITEIQQSVGFLRARDHVSPEKHSSMQAVFDYSWQLLSGFEQYAIRRLSVFRGGFDRDAANSVAGADLTIVATLVDRALLERTSNNRYQIHELLRQYLQDRLIEADEAIAARDAHLDYYTALAEQAEPELIQKQQYAWIDRLKLEIDNLGSALEWCLENRDSSRLEKGLHILVATQRLWTLHLWTRTGAGYLFRLLAFVTDNQDSRTFCRALTLAGRFSSLLENRKETNRYLADALEIGLRLNEPRLVADIYYMQGLDAADFRDYETAISCAGRALDAYQEINYEPGIAQALIGRGHWGLYSGNLSSATADLSTALILTKKLGDVRTLSLALVGLAEAAMVDPENLQPQQSGVYLYEALEYARRINDRYLTDRILNCLGENARFEGQFEKAIACYEECLSIERELGRQENIMLHEVNLAFAFSRLGRYNEARALFLKNLELALHSHHLEIEIAYCLLGLAGLAVTNGNAHLAAKALGSIESLKESILFYPADRDDYEHIIGATKVKLGEQQFDKLFREGKVLGEKQVAQIFLKPQTEEHTGKAVLPNSLTKRELEILRLVALGLSDAQVAEQLVISPRTINAHLTSIYRKLGINSRAAATRFAIEHGLA